RFLGLGGIASVTQGPVTTYFLAPQSSPDDIVVGPDGNLYFTEADAGKIGRLTTAGALTEFPVPSGVEGEPRGILAGRDGNLYFTEYGAGKIGRLTPKGTITEVAVPHPNAAPLGIVAGPDGAIWFTETERDAFGRLAPDGHHINEYPLYQVPPQTSTPTVP